MLYIVTYFEVQPNFAGEAVHALEKYRASCSAVTGIVQVEVLRERARTNRFVVLQAWSDEQSFQAHESGEAIRHLREELRAVESGPYDQRVHHGFVLTPARKSVDSSSVFVATHIDVPPPRKDETEVLLKKISVQAANDSGNKRYDVLQQTSRPNHFTTVAVWDNDASLNAHVTAAHTLEFRRALGPMAGGLYDERLYSILG